VKEQVIERERTGAKHEEHTKEDGEVDRVLRPRRGIENEIAAAFMTGEGSNDHVDRQRKSDGAGEETQRKKNATAKFDNGCDPGVEEGVRYAKVFEPPSKGGNAAGIGFVPPQFPCTVDDNADAQRNSNDKERKME